MYKCYGWHDTSRTHIWNISWNSMEHLCHLKWRLPNSMESLGTRWFSYLATPEFHGISWNIPWKSRVTGDWIKWQSQSSMEFHGNKWYFIWPHRSSMEFHGIFHGISWNTCVIWKGALLKWRPFEMEFHGTEWYFIWRHQSSMEFHGIRWNLMIVHLSALEFHGIWCHFTFHGTSVVSWNSMELLN